MIEESFAASLQDEQMILQSDEEKIQIPLYQIREVIFSSNMGSISIPLLEKMAEYHIMVLICNKKHYPVLKLCDMSMHFESSGHIADQAKWTMRKKSAVWRQIVKSKISMQIQLLNRLGFEVPVQMNIYKKEVTSNDDTNREAVAAKLYFSVLFGLSFHRFAEDNMNVALNYGYSILLSAFCRSITMHGYCSELGIYHCSRQNPYNLASDMMEPFRPFVDEVVFQNYNCPFDIHYRRKLIAILHSSCIFQNKKMKIADAIEAYTLEVVSVMETNYKSIGEIGFCDE